MTDSNIIEVKCLNCQQPLEIHKEEDVGTVCRSCNWISEIMPKDTFLKLLRDSELTSDQGVPFSDLDVITYKQQPFNDNSRFIFSYPALKKRDLEILKKRATVTGEAIEKFIQKGKDTLDKNEASRLRQFLANTSKEKLQDLIDYYRAKRNAYKFLKNSEF
jgi:hypothetical protein